MKKSIIKLSAVVLLIVMLLGTLAGCGGTGSTPPAGNEGASAELPKVNIRISGCNSMEHPQTLGLLLFKDLLEKQTDGKITVEVYPNSQLGAERESVEQVRNGTLEMATASAGPLTTFDKNFMLMDIPFTYDTYEEAWAVLDGQAGQDLLNSLESVGLKGLSYMENGFRHVTNKIKPIYKPADLKGLKIRTMEAPMHMENFTNLGANPTPVPWSELYLSMSQNIVDGQENPLANIWELSMFEVQDYVSLTGHIYDAMPLVTNLDWFNGLPLEYQALIKEAAILGANHSRFVNKSREDQIMSMLEDKGMEVNPLTVQEKDEFRNASQEAIVQSVKKEISPDVVDSYLNSIEAVKKQMYEGL